MGMSHLMTSSRGRFVPVASIYDILTLYESPQFTYASLLIMCSVLFTLWYFIIFVQKVAEVESRWRNVAATNHEEETLESYKNPKHSTVNSSPTPCMPSSRPWIRRTRAIVVPVPPVTKALNRGMYRV